MGECDSCGQDDPFCSCYEQELEKRISELERMLNLLIKIVDKLSTRLNKVENE